MLAAMVERPKARHWSKSPASTAPGSLGFSVRGKSAVKGTKVPLLGVVSVGYLLDSLQIRSEPYLAFLIVMALLVVAVNAVISSYVSRRFQRAILGFEPEEMGPLICRTWCDDEYREEGILSIDKNGILRSINKSACDILSMDIETEALNRVISDVLVGSDLEQLLSTGDTDIDVGGLRGEQ